MQLGDGAKFLNIIFLSTLFGAAAVYCATVMVPLTTIYASLWLHKLDINVEVLNLIWLFLLYVPCHSKLISTQFFVLSLGGWFGALSNKFFYFWYSIVILIY